MNKQITRPGCGMCGKTGVDMVEDPWILQCKKCEKIDKLISGFLNDIPLMQHNWRIDLLKIVERVIEEKGYVLPHTSEIAEEVANKFLERLVSK